MRRLDVVRQQHLPRGQHAAVAAVLPGQPLHELRVGAAAARARAVRVAQDAVHALGPAEPERGHRVDQRQRRDPVRAGPVDQVLQDHAAAHAPADQVHRVQPERLDRGRQVVRVVPQPAGRVHRLRVGVAEPAQVDRQRPVRLGQRQHGRLPEQRGRHVAVHEQHRRPGPARDRQHRHRQPASRHPLERDAGQQRLHRSSWVSVREHGDARLLPGTILPAWHRRRSIGPSRRRRGRAAVDSAREPDIGGLGEVRALRRVAGRGRSDLGSRPWPLT